MRTTNKEVKNVLVSFDQHRIAYAVSRNYDFLLQDVLYEGKDIDVVVRSKDAKKIAAIMEKKGFGVVPINPFSKHTGFAKYIPEDEKLLQFHFHLDGVTGRHTKYLDAATILSRRIKHSFFYAASPEDEFLIIALHNILDLDVIKEKYKSNLSSLAKQIDHGYVHEQLRKLFSEQQIQVIMSSISTGNFSRIEAIMPALKRRFEIRRLHKIAAVYVFGALWKLPRILKPAPLISFIGMDGAGKTTTTTHVKKILDANKVKYAAFYTGRGKDNILPIQFFGKIYRSIFEKDKEVQTSLKQAIAKKSSPKKAPFWKRMMYTLAAPIFAADLFLRYWISIFPQRLTKQVVITDRYSSDILLMVHVPEFIKKLLYVIFPRPTKTIYLWNTAAALHARKPEHPFDDLQRQEILFAGINKKIQPIKIKSEKIDNTVSAVSAIIFKSIFKY